MKDLLMIAVFLVLLALFVPRNEVESSGVNDCRGKWVRYQIAIRNSRPLAEIQRAERDFYTCLDPGILKDHTDLLDKPVKIHWEL